MVTFVLDPPSAKLEMNPMTVKDIDTMPKDVEVLLRCDVEDGNPTWTHRTRWYHNGVLFNETSEYELGLPGYRDQAGNYSCSLLNDADYGNLSLPVYLDVECWYYELCTKNTNQKLLIFQMFQSVVN